MPPSQDPEPEQAGDSLEPTLRGAVWAHPEPVDAGELETLRAAWRDAGFVEAAQSLLTMRPGPEARTRGPMDAGSPEEPGLPRISVDLQSTRTGRPEPPTAPVEGGPDLVVQGLLGEGGMGRVLLARQRSLDREVALKTLHPEAGAQHRDALVFEGAVMGFLEHPGIIPVHALGVSDDGRPVLVMKRVDGVAWRDLLRDPAHPAWAAWGGEGRDRLEAHLEILMQVCNAVHFAHSRGVVHRDIKPQNVLLGRFGDVYLADWGIAFRLGSRPPNGMCGTPGYMAPEMARGAAVDARTDVYLLGATLHELLTGRTRHGGAGTPSVLERALASSPVSYPPEVPEDLAALANRATARDPEARPASAAEFRRALADHLRHRSSLALGSRALSRLARLKDLVGGGAGEEEAQAEAERLIAEARFALSQALEDWPENPAAMRAQAELEAFLAARRARAAELERLARDLDPAVSPRQRAWMLLGTAAVAVSLGVLGLSRGLRYEPSSRSLFYEALAPLAAVAILTATLRPHLRKSAINRRMAAGLALAVLAVAVERLLGLWAGLGARILLFQDSLLLAVLAASAAATQFRFMVWPALLLLLSAVLSAAAPAYAASAFYLATSASVLLMAGFAWRMTRR